MDLVSKNIKQCFGKSRMGVLHNWGTVLTAFSLAEVLIVIFIIGFVANMTLPTLFHDIQDAQLKTAWKAAYSDISSAYARFLQDNGGTAMGVFPNDIDAINKLNPYLKNYTSAGSTNLSGQYLCGGSTTIFAYTGGGYGGIILSSGAKIGVVSHGCNNCNCAGAMHFCADLIIDVNGAKPPNIAGKDIFKLFLLQNRVIPAGASADSYSYKACIQQGELNWDVCTSPTYNQGWACSAKALNK